MKTPGRRAQDTHKRIVHVVHEPPQNELLIVLLLGISWGGAGVIFAIPALLLCTQASSC